MAKVMRDLFAAEPKQWGLRGDPWVWAAMSSQLAETPVPSSRGAVERLLTDTFSTIVGSDVTQKPLPEGSQRVDREELARRHVERIRRRRRVATATDPAPGKPRPCLRGSLVRAHPAVPRHRRSGGDLPAPSPAGEGPDSASSAIRFAGRRCHRTSAS